MFSKQCNATKANSLLHGYIILDINVNHAALFDLSSQQAAFFHDYCLKP